MKCREMRGQIVMTIFYEVDPTDIKKQAGDFGKAFKKTCKGKAKERIERWRRALEDVATIAGEHNWENEASMIEKIATDVLNILNISTPSRDFDGFAGMRTHMEKMEQLLRLDLDEELRMIGIWGPPGIGKTTIARVLFNQVSSGFQLGANIKNIKGYYARPCLDEHNAQVQLQNQMLSQLLNQKDIDISHLGVAPERLKGKKVLLVLDDVDQLGQLDALAGNIQWFGHGSRIIITTEDRRVLDAYRINHIYKVKFPSSDEAFQIFCMHAFGQKHPDDGFFELAWEVTYLAGELPLGLKVLGSALRGMSKQEWKRTLPRLKTRLVGDIGSIIKFSYDALCDEDKDLFLYIACLYLPSMKFMDFHFPKTHEVEEVLANKFLDVRQGLHVLAQKSLISIEMEVIHMHTLLHQFGRETSRKQFLHGFAKHQLLVNARDICEVLSDDTTDGRRFIGLDLDLSEIEEELNISEKAIERLHDFQFVRIRGNDRVHPRRLHSLLYHSQKIRSLHWNNFQNICLPSTFNPEFLVELNMRGSKLEKLWEGTKPLRNLKWMDLGDSRYLKELPDLSTATKLEVLSLDYCSSLLELPSSIGNAINLQELNLSYCSSLLKLPSSIGNAINLQVLKLQYCSSLLEVPSSIGNAINLHKVFLRGCSSLVELPSFIMNIKNLEELDLEGCASLVKLPYSLGNATNLQKLNLSRCTSLLEIPSSIENATNLQKLDLSDCSNLVELPSIRNATQLERLNLKDCSSLVKLPSSINAPNLQEFILKNCSRVVELPVLENATNLRKLNLRNCSSLQELPPSIRTATNLQILNIRGCSSLVKLPSSIGDLINLKKLYLSNCSSLVKLPSSIGDLTNLREFDLSHCSSLVELPSSIGNLQKLSFLRMCGCSKIEALPTNINLESLNELTLTDCSQLKSFPEISTNIVRLKLTGTTINEVPLSIMSWHCLFMLKMSYCESLKEFPHAFDIITELDLVNEDIKEVPPWVKGMSRLRELRLYNCNSLVSLPQFSDSLSLLVAENCQSLERLDCSFNKPNICLKVVNCFKLSQAARELIVHTSTLGYAMLPGTEVPDCFNYRATGGGSLTIKLNESQSLPTSLRFKACIMLVKDEEESGDDEEESGGVNVEIMGKQKGLNFWCKKLIYPILREHIYTFDVKAEEVTSTELVFQFETLRSSMWPILNSKWKIGECGLLQIKKRESEDRDEKKEESENSTLASCRI